MLSLKKAGGALALVAAMTAGAVAVSGPAFAITAPIHIAGTGGQGVNMRPGANTSSAAVGWIPEGASPDYTCFTYGQNVGGVSVWFLVNYGGHSGYYASYYDDSHYSSGADLTAKYGIPQCGAAPPVSPAAQGAINWANARLGQYIYQGYCLSFVYDAYRYGGGKDIGVAPTAVGWWNARPSAQHRGDTNPPAGSLAFWGPTTYNSAGHVALSLGGGQVISSEERTTYSIHTFSIAARNAAGYPYLGWIMP